VSGDDTPSGGTAPRAAGSPLRLAPEAAELIRSEIDRAGGREVCFLAEVAPDRTLVNPRAVARGNHRAVLAAARDAVPGGVMIHNHPSGALDPSEADLAVAARIYEEGLGSALVDNDAAGLYVMVEPPAPRVVTPLDLEELEEILAPGGPLSRMFDGFEDRPGQRRMLREVSTAFNEGGVTLVEAGTGTGKSLAYLLPAARWALQNGERTVLSTNTINLQEQLDSKDLPLVSRLTGEPLKWALVKGRGNYISIRRARLAAASQESLFQEDRSRELQAILEWIDATEDGSLSDLPVAPAEDVWEEVRSDGDICLRARCPHFQRCFYQRSRRNAAAAELLVVNHHLLFSDLSVRIASNNFGSSAVLPSYRKLILDEAHNVEDAATSHLGVELTRVGFYRTLSRLDRRGKGVLSALQGVLLGGGEGGEGERLNSRIETRIRPVLADVRARAALVLEGLEPLVSGQESTVRLGPGRVEPYSDEEFQGRLDSLLDSLGHLERGIRQVREQIESNEELMERLEERVLDLRSAERRLSGAATSLRLVLAPGPEGENYVRWLERRGGGRRTNLALAAAPLEPGPLLREALFEKVETVVLTSATLTTREHFRFLRSRLGLEAPEHDQADPWVPPEGVEQGASPFVAESWEDGSFADWGEESADAETVPVRELLLPSPFEYEEQAILVVPTDVGDFSSGGGGEAQRRSARFIMDLAERTDGGLFALFTSFRAIQAVAEELRASGAEGRWPLFVHGEGSRSRLLADFTASGRGILLGTASFWEGVDVPGHPLRGLVIQKLPFPVPTEPVVEARVESLEGRGVNSFWQYVLPLAALRLKQGFGRLIRARTDRGVVAILDSRILTRKYGAYFRDSLPGVPLVRGPAAEIWRSVDEFLANDPRPLSRGGGGLDFRRPR
jgi:ATP-dependent DNA helicase DinG